MTNIQIAYWNMKENRRHNYASEVETNRHNVRTEGQQDRALTETNRHNIATEALGVRNLAETQRHNIASENLGRSQLVETIRHNTASESIDRRRVAASELSAQASYMNAQTNKYLSTATYANTMASASNTTARTKGQNLDNAVRQKTAASEVVNKNVSNVANASSSVTNALSGAKKFILGDSSSLGSILKAVG